MIFKNSESYNRMGCTLHTLFFWITVMSFMIFWAPSLGAKTSLPASQTTWVRPCELTCQNILWLSYCSLCFFKGNYSPTSWCQRRYWRTHYRSCYSNKSRCIYWKLCLFIFCFCEENTRHGRKTFCILDVWYIEYKEKWC